MMTLFFMEKNNLYQKYDLDNIINKIVKKIKNNNKLYLF